ncbi:MAG: hypothetical protein ACC628_17650 [Pirellulaceae bacterium]
MRLTLRTMLAYLDDILEPGDAEELNQKIEESKFASELVHRIRSSTRRLRLGAPKLEGRGMGLDANTVAEYLDNTLPSDHVPDFEKVCLESDVHLAEVASGHQVLALVLGEPAEISQSVRERIYRIGRPGTDEDDETAGGAEHVPPAADLWRDVPTDGDEPPVEPSPMTKKDAIPDYMNTGSRIPIKSLAITLVCAFALAAVALRAMHPFDRDHPVFRFFAGGNAHSVAQAPDGTPMPDDPTTPTESKPDVDGDSKSQEPTQEPTPATETEGTEVPPDRSTETPMPGPGNEMSAESTVAPALGSDVPVEEFPKSESRQSVPSPADIPAPEEVMPSSEPPPTETIEPASVGRFISDEQVLGRLDRENGSWFRLEFNSPLSVGDRLVVLPTFRPQVLLSGSVRVTFSGPASVELAAGAEPDTPKLVFDYGRAAVVSVDDRGARVRLDLAGHSGIAVLPDADSALAVEVIPYLAPGADPLANPALMGVGLFATSGQVTWSEGPGEPLSVAAGQVLVLEGDDAPQLLDAGPLPDWIDGRDLSQLEWSASAELKTHLTTDRPISLSLLERTDFRRIEVAVLACRCLSYLDDFEPIVAALNDERHYSYWDGHFDVLRSALARSRESASNVLMALEKTYTEDSDDFFRMLWGYSAEQLESGEAENLVGFLEHNSMIARVLALENLRRITGKTLQFRPEETPGQERSKVARWRRDLEDGFVRYKNRPTAPGLSAPADE